MFAPRLRIAEGGDRAVGAGNREATGPSLATVVQVARRAIRSETRGERVRCPLGRRARAEERQQQLVRAKCTQGRGTAGEPDRRPARHPLDRVDRDGSVPRAGGSQGLLPGGEFNGDSSSRVGAVGAGPQHPRRAAGLGQPRCERRQHSAAASGKAQLVIRRPGRPDGYDGTHGGMPLHPRGTPCDHAEPGARPPKLFGGIRCRGRGTHLPRPRVALVVEPHRQARVEQQASAAAGAGAGAHDLRDLLLQGHVRAPSRRRWASANSPASLALRALPTTAATSAASARFS